MIANKITITRLDGYEMIFTNVTQLYTIGLFVVISGKRDQTLGEVKLKIAELQSMIVEF